MSTQWEYYKRRYMDCDFDVLGSDGWELAVVVADPSHTGYGQHMCLFKRPRNEKNNKLASLQGELLEERNARQNAQRDESAVREQLSEAQNHATTFEGLANQYRMERDNLEETCRMQRERMADLESRPVKALHLVKTAVCQLPEENNGFSKDVLIDKSNVLTLFDDAIAALEGKNQ